MLQFGWSSTRLDLLLRRHDAGHDSVVSIAERIRMFVKYILLLATAAEIRGQVETDPKLLTISLCGKQGDRGSSIASSEKQIMSLY